MSKPAVWDNFVVWERTDKDGTRRVGFVCPGCGQIHMMPVTGPKAWDFNNNFQRPTFSPSILAKWTYGEEHTRHVCHSFVREGRVEFLSDCTHALAGQTINMPLVP